MGNWDVFTFDVPVVNISGNLSVNAQGSGRIVIPAGVTVNVAGNFQLDAQNSGCSAANPCLFIIEVNGTINFDANFQSNAMTVVWAGNGTVTVDDHFGNSASGCMRCSIFGCPTFQIDNTDCRDEGSNCSSADFCAEINACASDVTRPVITDCPGNMVINMTGPGCTQEVSWTPPIASDNCTLSSFTSNRASGSAFAKGITTVTYTAVDAAGNRATCSFNVNVVDDIDPVITGCPADITVSASTTCQAVVTWPAPSFTDNCTGGTLIPSKASGSTFAKGMTTVTYTATDAAGNTATCSFKVNVVDNTAPVITGCPADITVNASATCQAVVTWTAPSFTDNCTGGTLIPSKPSGSTFAKGTTTVTYTATDAAGNTATCSFNVNVVDNLAPIITGCPSDITVTANTACKAVVTWTVPSFTDDCEGGILAATKIPGSVFNAGTTVVTYTATDAAGNTATCSFKVKVIDDLPPVIANCPADITINANSSCQAVVNWTEPSVSDNCEGAALTVSKPPGSVFDIGTTAVTYMATDAAGNTSSCSFKVNVGDKTGPAITRCPADIVASADASCHAVVMWTVPQGTDNCSNVTIRGSHQPGDVFALGTTQVKYTATDEQGNVSVCAFNVIVRSEAFPVVQSCPADLSLEANEHRVAKAVWVPPTASIACGEVFVTSSHQPEELFDIGTTEVEYKATAKSGNTTSCRFKVIVRETELAIDVGKVLTPDGDGINDEWTLANIEKFKDNNVVVVDRWGSLIFMAKGYNNENVVWRGTNQSGSLVPTGTYYYTISVRYGASKAERRGFVEIIR